MFRRHKLPIAFIVTLLKLFHVKHCKKRRIEL
nr:MAG TPA: hypothetical protein [Caudoviricetes sp.]